jgi:glyoxylase-like metal-dependent hydrolase (beta-lactamase superfamily II)
MENMFDLADRLWRGETPLEYAYPMTPRNELAEVSEGTAFINSFANVSALRTEAGLVLVDTGSPLTAQTVHGLVRGWNRQPLHTAVYTHGHIYHVFGVPIF